MRKKINKGGRPKNKPRPSIDLGTPELIMKRTQISPEDATLASCPLDAIKALRYDKVHPVISLDAYNAACAFRATRQNVFGSPHPKAMDLLHATGGEPTGGDATDEAEFRRACDMLKSHGRGVFDAVDNVIIHERYPGWLKGKQSAHCPDRKKFMLGLSVLIKWAKTRRAQKAA